MELFLIRVVNELREAHGYSNVAATVLLMEFPSIVILGAIHNNAEKCAAALVAFNKISKEVRYE